MVKKVNERDSMYQVSLVYYGNYGEVVMATNHGNNGGHASHFFPVYFFSDF